MDTASTVAYFSMEIGFDAAAPTYSGGLGVLAGDTMRAAADLSVPVVGVSLLYRDGHLRQHLDPAGVQSESQEHWSPDAMLQRLEARSEVSIEGRKVMLQVWTCEVIGETGARVRLLFLDSSVPENEEGDRTLTDRLYGGDRRYRLCQEVILGLGGLRMLRALGYDRLRTFHMNEGHSALLSIGLLEERLAANGGMAGEPSDGDIEAVRGHCVFTTHTPVPAGHDRFDRELVRSVLGETPVSLLERLKCMGDELNMTYLALYFARYINGVSMRHEAISKGMFPHYPIQSITNGVHVATWTSRPFRELFDEHIPSWRRDNFNLRYAVKIPIDEIQRAHAESKRLLIEDIERRSGVELDAHVLTLGFARRATPYKRADLIFRDLERLRRVHRESGPLQLVFAGRAHPADGEGKAMIQRVFDAATELAEDVRVVYLEQYDMTLGGLLTSGVDVWLNTPRKPQEASGTSGMKAALNGIPSLSVLDGWWIEGHIEGVTGWAIEDSQDESDSARESVALYDKLEYVIAPMFYARPRAWAELMRSCISLNGSFFNAQRMMAQYRDNAYAFTT